MPTKMANSTSSAKRQQNLVNKKPPNPVKDWVVWGLQAHCGQKNIAHNA